MQTATFGAGCFWCVEAVFQRIEGVDKVESGYSGGKYPNPTYREICSGLSGHAEVCQITYDENVVPFQTLLEVFWQTHDPTTLNRQGNDRGTQYRSVIFYHNKQQQDLAEHYMQKLDQSGAFHAPIVTEISPYSAFYLAEAEHQDFYNRNTEASYCQYIIVPKLDKLKSVFNPELLK